MTTQPDRPDGDSTEEGELFSSWLAKHRNGKVDRELTAALRDNTSAVMLHKGKGVVTLKITVQQLKGDEDTLQLFDEVVTKPPRPERSGHIYWGNPQTGELSLTPNQQRLGFKKGTNQ